VCTFIYTQIVIVLNTLLIIQTDLVQSKNCKLVEVRVSNACHLDKSTLVLHIHYSDLRQDCIQIWGTFRPTEYTEY
jgi:hypothetical protein